MRILVGALVLTAAQLVVSAPVAARQAAPATTAQAAAPPIPWAYPVAPAAGGGGGGGGGRAGAAAGGGGGGAAAAGRGGAAAGGGGAAATAAGGGGRGGAAAGGGGGGGRGGAAAGGAAEPMLSLPGSTRQFTATQVRTAFDVADWRPDLHPAMPEVVSKGRQPDVRACGFCHLANGQGRPENAGLAGQPIDYIIQQM